MAVVAIAAITIAVGLLNHAFLPFPKGYDAYGHMSKVKYLVDYFPNAGWNSEWYSGQFFSEGSFPPLFHYLAALLVDWFGASLEGSLVLIGAASFVVIACGLYGLVRVATGNVFAGAIAALLLLSANSYWSYILLGGLYPRILGMAFLTLFAFFAVLHLKTGSVAAYVAAVLTLAATLSSHLLLGAIAVLAAALIVALLSQRRLRDGAKLLVPAALLVAYFYVPYVAGLSRPAPVPLLTREYVPLTPDALLALMTPKLEAMSSLIPALALVFVPAVYFGRRFVLDPLVRRLMPALAIGGAGALVYALVGLPLPHLFVYNFQPGQALFFAAWFLAGLIGLASAAVAPPRAPRLVLPLIMLLLLGVIVSGPTRLSLGVIEADTPAKQQLLAAMHVDESDLQHRIGASSDQEADWIDARHDVPQTRGYQQQGVIDGEWQYWFESRVWIASPNYDEKNFLLDWNAVRSFYGGPAASTFALRPDLYAPQDSSRRTFDFLRAGQILSASSTRSALVIGGDAAYRYFVRALAASDFDSTSLIPVRGGDYLDDHSLAELRRFDMVVLYGFRAHDLVAAFRMLNAFVVGGGSVLVEANSSPLESAAEAPPPIPGSSVQKGDVSKDWGFTAAPSPITTGVHLLAFDPPVFNGGPWGVSYIPQSSIASWAAPVVWSVGRPVVVAGMLGAGHVVWSGLNLPYHAATTVNAEESRLLANEITWAAPASSSQPAFRAEFVNPELRRVVAESPAGGVLFKESWVANWQATVNGRPATVYRAGPDFMYVPLGPDVTYPATVAFEFGRTAVEWLGDGISVATLLVFGAWLIAGRRGRRRVSSPSPPTR